jgi:hypothetical protein
MAVKRLLNLNFRNAQLQLKLRANQNASFANIQNKKQHFKDYDDLSFTREPRWPDDRRKMSRSMLHI